MSEADRIIALLRSPSIEKQIAATIVLAELGVKSARCTDELGRLVTSEVPLMQRHALEALTKLGAKKAAADIFPLLTSSDGDVRRAAAAALTSVGEEIVPAIRERAGAAMPEERRALDAILAELGGKAAFSALIAGLAEKEGDEANAAALAFRQRIRGADARQKKSYLASTEKFLQKKGLAPNAVAAGIKLLGFLEDEQAIPTLLAHAEDREAPPAIRQEAIIALRFALGQGKANARVLSALIDAAESPDRTLSQTALHTLGSLPLPDAAVKRLEKLLAHPDPARAAFVTAMLGRLGTAEATRALVSVVLSAEARRAELAARELEGKEIAVAPLGKALLEAKQGDRARLLKNVLRPLAKDLPPALRKEIETEAMDRLADGKHGWDALLDVARAAEPDSVAASLRALAAKLKKGGNPERALGVLSVLCHSDRAKDDDRYAMASLLLGKSPKDTRQASRSADEALTVLTSLLGRGFDVAGALKKDKTIELDHIYYVGFHFAEEQHPIGEDLLSRVADQGGRTKVGKMAKNKLALMERA